MNQLPEEDLQHIFNHTAHLWEEMRNKTVFITGGTGFIGAWFLEIFSWVKTKKKININVVVLSRNPGKFKEKAPHLFQNNNFEFVAGNINDFKIDETTFSYIIHLAAESENKLYQSDPLLMVDTITNGTRRLLDFAKQQKSLKSFLFVSSGAVYGNQSYDETKENQENSFLSLSNDPKTTYAVGKRMAEFYCRIYGENSGIPIKIARCFTFYGPYMQLNKHFAIGNFINNLINKKTIIINGDGTPVRSYLYISDVIIWLITIISEGANLTPYNVGSQLGISIRELAYLVAGLSKTPLNVEFNNIRAPGDIDKYIPLTCRAEKEFNLQQYISLQKGISKTISYYYPSFFND